MSMRLVWEDGTDAPEHTNIFDPEGRRDFRVSQSPEKSYTDTASNPDRALCSTTRMLPRSLGLHVDEAARRTRLRELIKHNTVADTFTHLRRLFSEEVMSERTTYANNASRASKRHRGLSSRPFAKSLYTGCKRGKKSRNKELRRRQRSGTELIELVKRSVCKRALSCSGRKPENSDTLSTNRKKNMKRDHVEVLADATTPIPSG